MSVPERVTVSAIVKARAEEEDGWKLELEVPQFRSKYPTKVSRVPERVASLLLPRAEPYQVVLLRENLMKDKTGDLPWQYYWGLEGLATAAEMVAKASKPDPLEEREHRIMRSTALAQAVAFRGSSEETAQVLEVAAEFYAWLRDGPQTTQDDPVLPQGTASGPSPVSSSSPPAAGTPLVSREDVITWARKNGYPTLKDMAAVPGVAEAMKEQRYADAFTLLDKARTKGES